jgi:hypothetical protein
MRVDRGSIVNGDVGLWYINSGCTCGGGSFGVPLMILRYSEVRVIPKWFDPKVWDTGTFCVLWSSYPRCSNSETGINPRLHSP